MRQYTCGRMSLSFGPRQATARRPDPSASPAERGALAALAAAVAYAALPRGAARRWLVGGRARALLARLAAARRRRWLWTCSASAALRLRAGAVGHGSGWCSRSTRSSASCPQLPARAGRSPALGAAAVLLALAVSRARRCTSGASPWLPLHWPLGVASYGLFAAAVVHAWLLQPRRTPACARPRRSAAPGVPLLTLERLTFRFAAAGFVVLLGGASLAGCLFTRTAPWRWDHKTVFSVLGWLVFAGLLLGRARFGWRGRKAVRGSTPARCCCCWPTSARASCSRSCCTAPPAS